MEFVYYVVEYIVLKYVVYKYKVCSASFRAQLLFFLYTSQIELKL